MNGSRMLEIQPIPEIHQSRDDIHLIVDKAHRLQASTKSCVNILLHYSNQLGRIGIIPKPMPFYHSTVLPGKTCRPNIAKVDRWKIYSAQSFGLYHPSKVILHKQRWTCSRQHRGGLTHSICLHSCVWVPWTKRQDLPSRILILAHPCTFVGAAWSPFLILFHHKGLVGSELLFQHSRSKNQGQILCSPFKNLGLVGMHFEYHPPLSWFSIKQREWEQYKQNILILRHHSLMLTDKASDDHTSPI